MVAGGYGDRNRLSTVWALSSGSNVWTSFSELPRTLTNVRSSIVGGRLRLFGGFDGSPRAEVRVHVLQTNYLPNIVMVRFLPKKNTVFGQKKKLFLPNISKKCVDRDKS